MEINVKIRLDSPDLMNSILALAEAIMQPKPNILQQEKVGQTVTVKKEEVKAVTLETLRERLAALSQAGKSAEVKALINKYGASKLTEIGAENYEVLYREAGKYIN